VRERVITGSLSLSSSRARDDSVRASARVRAILFNAHDDRERELDFIYDGVRLVAAKGVRTLDSVTCGYRVCRYVRVRVTVQWQAES